MIEKDENYIKDENLEFIALSSASSEHWIWATMIGLRTIVFKFLILWFTAVIMELLNGMQWSTRRIH